MATVTIYQAKTHFSQLIQRALAGEEIVISRGKQPVAKIVPLPGAREERTLGGAKGIVKWISPEFDEPLEEFEDHMK